MERRGGSAALVALAVAMTAAVAFTGCGTPGTPLPPSLKLPDPVTNLAAVRTGNQVALTWTMPRKNTDKLLIKGNVPVRICRKERSGVCLPVPANLSFAPNAKAAFTDTLPPDLAAGAPRPLTYFVELNSPHGRSAGPSNAAHVLAGQAPDPVAGLSAQLRKDGVVLRWTWDESPAQQGQSPAQQNVIRLHRKLLTPAPNAAAASPSSQSSSQKGLLAPAKEPIEQTLLVEAPAQFGPTPDRVLDKTILFGRTYEYRAQRVARIAVDGQTVELAGPLSDPIRVEAIDTFPPAVPSGLAAVATAADSAAGPSIDLSWLPVAEADLAGYAVYRREASAPGDTWQRISPAPPVIGPAFHDPNVQPGHTYRYAVAAIDQLGHESAHSLEAEETVPSP
jgi:hypothetical protein